jgi:hypothetical protein
MAVDFGPLTAPLPPPQCAAAIKAARAKLRPHSRRTSIWSLVGAAAFFAGSSLALAAAVILGPPQLGGDPAPALRPVQPEPALPAIPHAVAVPEN